MKFGEHNEIDDALGKRALSGTVYVFPGGNSLVHFAVVVSVVAANLRVANQLFKLLFERR